MSIQLYRGITKKVSVSQHIEKFEFNLGVMRISIWVVCSRGKYYLVDTGMGGMAQYIAKNYLRGEKIETVFLTHGHSDHIGGVKLLKSVQPEIKLQIDELEFPYISGTKPYPGRTKIEKKVFDPADFLSLRTEAAIEVQHEAGLEALFAPGHSPGHHCFYHRKDDVVIAGDLFTTNRKGMLKPPMKQYTANMAEALKAGYQIVQQHPTAVLSVCHGTEVRDAWRVLNEADWNR